MHDVVYTGGLLLCVCVCVLWLDVFVCLTVDVYMSVTTFLSIIIVLYFKNIGDKLPAVFY